MTEFRRFCGAFAAASLAVLAAVLPLQGAHATEGVIQINQARAIAGGVTAGDAAGFPVTISAPGSYVLTGDLTLPDTATTAISVTADWVTIDLNGFEIAGPNSCTWNGSGVDCTATSTGDGINADSQQGLAVRNGTIRGMGDDGIEAGTGTRVENVTADSNGGVGIDLWTQGYVTESTVRLNGGNGLVWYSLSVLERNAARRNHYQGFTSGAGRSIVKGNTAVENGNRGISGHNYTLMHDNVALGNLYFGVAALSLSNLYNNTVANSGSSGITSANHSVLRNNASRENAWSGLETSFTGSVVLDNVSKGNTGWGLSISPGNAYGGNNLLNNTEGTVEDGTELRPNLCDGNTSCP